MLTEYLKTSKRTIFLVGAIVLSLFLVLSSCLGFIPGTGSQCNDLNSEKVDAEENENISNNNDTGNNSSGDESTVEDKVTEDGGSGGGGGTLS